MKYDWITQHGALMEGQETITEAEVVDVLSGRDAMEDQDNGIIRNLATRRIPRPVVELVAASTARDEVVMPVRCDGGRVTLAAVDPDDIGLADKLRFLMNRDVRMVHAPRRDILAAIHRHYSNEELTPRYDMVSDFTETQIVFSDEELSEISAQATTEAESVRPKLETRQPQAGEACRLASKPHSKRVNPSCSPEPESMFHYIVDEDQRVLMTDRFGRSEVVQGPRRLWRGFRRFERLRPVIAHPGEFLIVRFRDGRQDHVPGPAEVWLDRRVHESVEKQDALQISANEAVVIYTKEPNTDTASRRVELGPQLFVPRPGEWLHTFQWHAARGGSQGAPKIAKGLVFQKLWLMPDQMYHDVPDVRTADDAVLTIRLMIFFELQDVMQMLDTTHDPIGDFVNAATADVVEFTGQFDFENFKQHTHQLNELETYRHLLDRAAQCGYRINNVVYRGYGAPDSLQQMHDQAIEARTRLQLDRATEEQAQQLEDYKLKSQLARAANRRSEQAAEVRHELELGREKLEAELQRQEAHGRLEREQQELAGQQTTEADTRRNQVQQQHLQTLKEMGVDLTQFLTQARADQVIEVRGEAGPPHVHMT